MKAICLLLASVFLLLPVQAAEKPKLKPLAVARYVQLSIERLELARSCWYWQKSAPTVTQLNALWAKHQTTEQEFLSFGSRNLYEVRAYLEAYPDLKERIDVLSAETRQYVQQVAKDLTPHDVAVDDGL